LIEEVRTYINSIDVTQEGEHIYSNYEEIIAISLRLQEIHNEIALLEIRGEATNELKKFRTMVLDSSLERLDKLAVFESRKITAKRQEWEMNGKD
jgi:hypothetical protein